MEAHHPSIVEEGAAKRLSNVLMISSWAGNSRFSVSRETCLMGWAGFQHLDNLVRTQALTGLSGHQLPCSTMFHVKHC